METTDEPAIVRSSRSLICKPAVLLLMLLDYFNSVSGTRDIHNE